MTQENDNVDSMDSNSGSSAADSVFTEGEFIDVNDLPVHIFKGFDVAVGTTGEDKLEVLFLVVTTIDVDTMDEAGVVYLIPSEDALEVARRIKSVAATVSPVAKQIERLQSPQEEVSDAS